MTMLSQTLMWTVDTALVGRVSSLALGAVAGTMAGLFGIGGGLVIVPVLIFAFRAQGIDEGVLTQGLDLALAQRSADRAVVQAELRRDRPDRPVLGVVKPTDLRPRVVVDHRRPPSL